MKESRERSQETGVRREGINECIFSLFKGWGEDDAPCP